MRNRSNRMLLFSAFMMMMVTLLALANLFSVSILGFHYLSQTNLHDYSDNINLSTNVINAQRGLIYDKDMNILAEDVVSYTLYAIVDPKRPALDGHQAYVSDFDLTSQKLSEILNADKAYFLERLKQALYQTEFGSIGRQLSATEKSAIEALDLPGLGFIETQKRTYPLDSFASYLLGFANDDETTLEPDMVGRMGLEASLNDRLKGINGYQISTVDSQGYVLPGSKQTITPAVNGNAVVLTLDRTLQDQLESTIKETETAYAATQTWGSIVEIKTGKILAFAQNKNFDLNKIDTANFMNFGSQLIFEPGSTMKTFTYAAAIEEGVYEGTKLFNSAPFIYGYVGGKLSRLSSYNGQIGVINNVNKANYGNIDYNTGYAVSSNVGVASLLTSGLDPEVFKKYLNDFHFFEAVDTDIQPETFSIPAITRTADLLHIGFGQGISVNMLQMVQAYISVMNGGVMMKPYVVDRIINQDTNEVLVQNEPTIVDTPVSANTAAQVVELMRFAVTSPMGTCHRFIVDTVDIICKSGTAQLVENGAYSNTEYIYSVVLGLPYDDPEIMLFYAFRSPTMLRNTEQTRQIKEIIKTIEFYSMDHQPVNEEIVSSYVLPNFINHSTSFVSDLLRNQTSPILLIGNGSSIINQYPQPGTKILSTQRLLLLSSTKEIVMPEMKSWSKKDVLAFFKLVNRSVSVDGEGFVSSQSIPAGTVLSDQEVTFILLSH